MNDLRRFGAAFLIVLACGSVAACSDDDDGHRIAAAADGREHAVLDVVSGATTITVRAADIGDDLYRAATPDDSGYAPRMVNSDDRFDLHIEQRGPGGLNAVDVQLSDDVAWDLRFTGGVTQLRVDMGAGRLTTVDFAGGASRIELTVPRPAAEHPVRMSGGVSQLLLHAPSDVPVRVRAGGGAGVVTVDGQEHRGVAAGSTFASAGWDAPNGDKAGLASTGRYDLDCTAGAGLIVVDRTPPNG